MNKRAKSRRWTLGDIVKILLLPGKRNGYVMDGKRTLAQLDKIM